MSVYNLWRCDDRDTSGMPGGRVHFGRVGSVPCVCHEYTDGYACGPCMCAQPDGQSSASPCVITRTRESWDAIRRYEIRRANSSTEESQR